METILVEVRAAEGGMDARLLVLEQSRIYQKWCTINGLEVQVVEEHPGILVFQVSRVGAKKAFQHEAGGIRWQRVPPTEKRGRVHTSTITVAILDMPDESTVKLDERDLEIKATCGHGAGGQNRNKTASTIQMTHKPTGLAVRCETERSQQQNLRLAKAILSARIQEQDRAKKEQDRNSQRKAMVGSGMRGDKIRTVALQRGQVVDHVLGTRMDTERYLKGNLEPLRRQKT